VLFSNTLRPLRYYVEVQQTKIVTNFIIHDGI